MVRGASAPPGQLCQAMLHQVRRWQLGHFIQWPLRRPGIHSVPVSQRSPRSVRFTRVRAWHVEQVTTTVPVWRGPVE